MITVYKASAGSGKTYTLTQEYLRICFQNAQNPSYFQHILAMTFTNDATCEMRGRIMGALYDLQDGRGDHLSYLQKTLECDLAHIRRIAKSILERMLLDYDQIAIVTLDSFFQRVLRCFQFELNIKSSTTIELNINSVLKGGLDAMLANMDLESLEYESLAQIILDKLGDAKAFSIKDEMMNLGRLVLDDEAVGMLAHTSDLELRDFNQKIRELIDNIEDRILRLTGRLADKLDEIDDVSIDDFSGKSRQSPFKIFYERDVSIGDVLDKADRLAYWEGDVNKWFSRDHFKKNEIKLQAVYDLLNPALSELLVYVQDKKEEYASLLVLRDTMKFYVLANRYHQNILQWCESNQRTLLSFANPLLRAVIERQSMPFFYEKMGSQYRHLLLDEFQDTSRSQWHNLIPLVEHAVDAAGGSVLVVGDPKQAIYRWRNGDWRILQYQIKEHFEKLGLYRENRSEYNFRSQMEVINFNNWLYAAMPAVVRAKLSTYLEDKVRQGTSLEFPMFEDIYSGSKQEQLTGMEKSGGYVELNLLQVQGDKNAGKDKIKDYKWSLIQDRIVDLVDRGYRLDDICFLVRTNSQAKEIGEKLKDCEVGRPDGKRYFFTASVGNQRVTQSLVVQAILALFQISVDENNEIAWAEWRQAMSLLTEKENGQSPVVSLATGDEGVQEIVSKVRSMPLWSAFYFIHSSCHFSRYQNDFSYVSVLEEAILNFARERRGHIREFLAWWVENPDMQSLPSSAERGIKIVTVHKSKGLQYPVVIMPFDWKIVETDSKKSALVWSRPMEVAGLSIPSVPFPATTRALGTRFESYAVRDFEEQGIEALNLFYVATTRVESELYFFFDLTKEPQKSGLLSLSNALYNLTEDVVKEEFNSDYLIHHINKWGLKDFRIAGDTEDSTRYLLSAVDEGEVHRELPRLSVGRDQRIPDWSDARSRGRVLHQLMEGIDGEEDIPNVLLEFREKGVLASSELDDVEAQLRGIFSDVAISEVLSRSGKRMNERGLRRPEGQVYRPDRVILGDTITTVVDFKTGQVYDKNRQQLQQYVDCLRDMGKDKVEAYLLYLDSAELVRVI